LLIGSVVAVLDTVAILYPSAEKALATPAPIFLPAPKISATGDDVDMVDMFPRYRRFERWSNRIVTSGSDARC
jgi:hypothetical protein